MNLQDKLHQEFYNVPTKVETANGPPNCRHFPLVVKDVKAQHGHGCHGVRICPRECSRGSYQIYRSHVHCVAEFAVGNTEAPKFSWMKMADWIREQFKFQETPLPMVSAQLQQTFESRDRG